MIMARPRQLPPPARGVALLWVVLLATWCAVVTAALPCPHTRSISTTRAPNTAALRGPPSGTVSSSAAAFEATYRVSTVADVVPAISATTSDPTVKCKASWMREPGNPLASTVTLHCAKPPSGWPAAFDVTVAAKAMHSACEGVDAHNFNPTAAATITTTTVKVLKARFDPQVDVWVTPPAADTVCAWSANKTLAFQVNNTVGLVMNLTVDSSPPAGCSVPATSAPGTVNVTCAKNATPGNEWPSSGFNVTLTATAQSTDGNTSTGSASVPISFGNATGNCTNQCVAQQVNCSAGLCSCQLPGTCDPATGVCSAPINAPNGGSCTLPGGLAGTCQGGRCIGYFKTDLHGVQGITVNDAGVIFAADRSCHTFCNVCMRCGLIYEPSGKVSTLILFNDTVDPRGVAVDTTSTTFYWSDYANKQVLAYGYNTSTGKPYIKRVLGNSSVLASAFGVVLLQNQSVLVSDSINKSVAMFDGNGTFMGKLGEGFLSGPAGMSLDTASGLLYVADPPANAIKVFALNGTLVGQFGGFKQPYGVSARNGSVYVADTSNNRVVKLDSSGRVLGTLGGIYVPYSVVIGTLPAPCPYFVVTDGSHAYMAIVSGL